MLESHTKVVNLPEDEPAAFRLVLEAVHQKPIATGIDPKTLIEAYLLADKLGMEAVTNVLTDSIIEEEKWQRVYSAYEILAGDLGDLPPNCLLRRYLVEILAWGLRFKRTLNAADIEWVTAGGEDVVEVFKLLASKDSLTGWPYPKKRKCLYHSHLHTKPCQQPEPEIKQNPQGFVPRLGSARSAASDGTAGVPFAGTVEKSAPGSTLYDAYQSINFMEPYQEYSFEELRQADYNAARRYGNGIGQAVELGENAFGVLALRELELGTTTSLTS